MCQFGIVFGISVSHQLFVKETVFCFLKYFCGSDVCSYLIFICVC